MSLFKKKDYRSVYNYYVTESKRIIEKYDKPMVLKMDCYNEAEIHPLNKSLIKNVKGFKKLVMIEYDEEFIKQAHENLKGYDNYEIIKGDIRVKQEDLKDFDVILDLSTIDHVEQESLETVFDNYASYMKSDGLLLIVAWVKMKPDDKKINDWRSTNQYYHDYYFFKEKLLKNFLNIEEEELIIYERDNNKRLYKFLCKKC